MVFFSKCLIIFGEPRAGLLLFFIGGSIIGASLMAQMVKCLPATGGDPVRSLGREDLLEEEMAPHSSTPLAWKIPRTEEPDRLLSRGLQRVRHD